MRRRATTDRAARALRCAAALLIAAALASCTTVIARSPAPEGPLAAFAPYGVEAETFLPIRSWGDSIDVEDPQAFERAYERRARRLHADEIREGRTVKVAAIAFSGGGPDGAFGAGLMNGWTARGDRPQFQIVSGISTGAIIALFAFLGPDYDDELTEVYTTYATADLLQETIFAALTGGTALASTARYRALIERYVDEEVMRRLAAAHALGRVLLVGTTNLDAARPVTWSLTGIASTGHPEARRLIVDVIQASSAIPAAFPPVLIPVTGADGETYDEMHVDGGATQQVMLYSPSVPLKRFDDAIGLRADRDVYVVMNNKLRKPRRAVRPRLVAIASASASSLLGGSGGADLYKLYAIAQRDEIDMRITWIPTDFAPEPTEIFDPVYMKALYDLGYEYGLAGDRWSAYPPDFTP